MRELSYPAILTSDNTDGGFVITFPDFPEAITQVDSFEEGLKEATDCLDEAIQGRLRLHKPLPDTCKCINGEALPDTCKCVNGEGGKVIYVTCSM